MTESEPARSTANTPLSAMGVLGKARALQTEAEAGQIVRPLRGKFVGLWCGIDDSNADEFRRAAEELGATVAHIGPSLSELSSAEEVLQTGQALGQLYDALECQGMAPALVEQLRVSAGIPVYDGLASSEHPTAPLVEQLGGNALPADKRRFVLQAVLLCTIT